MKIDINFTFKNYKTLKTHNYFNNNFLIITNNNFVFKNKLNEKKNSNKKILSNHKITNKSFFSVINKSLFKKFEKLINGPIFFFCFKNFFASTKIIILNKKNLSLLNILAFKLNNKMYLSKKLFRVNFLTYQENLITLFQLHNILLKNILK